MWETGAHSTARGRLFLRFYRLCRCGRRFIMITLLASLCPLPPSRRTRVGKDGARADQLLPWELASPRRARALASPCTHISVGAASESGRGGRELGGQDSCTPGSVSGRDVWHWVFQYKPYSSTPAFSSDGLLHSPSHSAFLRFLNRFTHLLRKRGFFSTPPKVWTEMDSNWQLSTREGTAYCQRHLGSVSEFRFVHQRQPQRERCFVGCRGPGGAPPCPRRGCHPSAQGCKAFRSPLQQGWQQESHPEAK